MKKSRKPDQYDKDIGTKLARLRKVKGKSQQELGEALGLSAQQIGKYERGENRISTGRHEQATSWLNSLPDQKPAGGFEESQTPYHAATDIRAVVSGSLKRMKDEIGILESVFGKL